MMAELPPCPHCGCNPSYLPPDEDYPEGRVYCPTMHQTKDGWVSCEEWRRSPAGWALRVKSVEAQSAVAAAADLISDHLWRIANGHTRYDVLPKAKDVHPTVAMRAWFTYWRETRRISVLDMATLLRVDPGALVNWEGGADVESDEIASIPKHIERRIRWIYRRNAMAGVS